MAAVKSNCVAGACPASLHQSRQTPRSAWFDRNLAL